MSGEIRAVREEIGLDLGATLTKAVVVDVGAPLTDFQTFLFPSDDRTAIATFLGRHANPILSATGAGARRLAKQFTGSLPVVIADEFAAWGLGEELLLQKADRKSVV